MDKTTLLNKQNCLVEYMIEKGYNKDYCALFQAEFNRVIREVEHNSDITFEEIYQRYVERGFTKFSLKQKRNVLGIIKRFIEDDKLPDGVRSGFLKRDKVDGLSPEFKRLIELSRVSQSKTGKRSYTIHTETLNAIIFFKKLQDRGTHNLLSITEQQVLDVFKDYRMTYVKNVRAVVKSVIEGELATPCKRLLSFFPSRHEQRKNIQYLTDEELAKVKLAIIGNIGNLTLRNRAIAALACYTGLRGCDIAALKLTDIDWDSDLLNITQRKTGVPIKLSLSALVGNAIYDYITQERPNIKSPYLFLTENKQVRPLDSRSMWYVSERIMRESGIRLDKGDRKGLHIFRHRLASSLLENNIPQPVISSILGHSNPRSTSVYLSTDFRHLKECALSIERFPIGEEVFHV